MISCLLGSNTVEILPLLELAPPPPLELAPLSPTENTERETVAQNIAKARKASYRFMSAGFHGKWTSPNHLCEFVQNIYLTHFNLRVGSFTTKYQWHTKTRTFSETIVKKNTFCTPEYTGNSHIYFIWINTYTRTDTVKSSNTL